MIYFGREMMIEWIEYVKDMNVYIEIAMQNYHLE